MVGKDKRMDYSLWNPAKELPQTVHVWEHAFAKFGFGWDEASGAYKVFAYLPSALDYNIGVGKLYSSKTNSWKTVDASICTIVYACGKLYWSTTNDEIEWFDLESEEFGRMELPFGDEYTLVDVEEKEKAGLHLLFEDDSEIGHYRVEVWVMNKDQCWFKVMSLPMERFWFFILGIYLFTTPEIICFGQPRTPLIAPEVLSTLKA